MILSGKWWIMGVGAVALVLVSARVGADDEALTRARSALEAVRRLKGADLEAKPALKAAIQRLAVQLQGQPELVELVRDFGLTNQYPALLQFAVDHPTDPVAGEALRTLLTAQPALLTAALENPPQAVPLLTALGTAGQREAVPLLLPWLAEAPGRSLAVRRTALRGLVKTQEGAGSVLALAEAKGLPADLMPLAAVELQSVRWAKIKADAARVLPPPPRTASALPPVSELARRTGDPVKGAQIFRRAEAACITCHQVNGEGVDFGPKLSEIGSKLGKDALYDAILEPSTGISFGYEAWSFTFKNGDEAFGILASETEGEIAMKSLGGVVIKYRTVDVVKREKQAASIMPEGLATALSATELVDLVEYLSTLRKATN